MKNPIYILVFLVLSMSCGNSSTNNEINEENKKDTTTVDLNQKDTIQNAKDTLIENELPELLSVKDWKTQDFIVTEKFKSSEAVKRTIAYRVEEWKNVENPIIAKYQGCDFGDYFHLSFVDAKGKIYDFGSGENEFGEYPLYSGEHYVDNPKYLGKTFKIYWNWKVASFPCCDGDYDKVEAYLPGIVKLELLE